MNRQTVVLALIIAGIVCSPAQGKYGGGTGEPNDPYFIYDANQMQAIGADSNDWDKCFKLMADIDLSGYDGNDGRPKFNIIAPDMNVVEYGFQGVPFTGVFDGNGHSVSHFTYFCTYFCNDTYIGLFGYVDGSSARIANLHLIEPAIYASGLAGALVGVLEEGCVERCSVQGGRVEAGYHFGGMVGVNEHGEVRDCFSSTEVVVYVGGNGIAGGLVGSNKHLILRCWSKAIVSGIYGTGGIAGRNDGLIENCYSAGVVDGFSHAGGLAGEMFDGAAIKSYSRALVSGRGRNVGGFVGVQGSIPPVHYDACFWDTNVCGDLPSVGNAGVDPPGVIKATTEDMKRSGTFVDQGWDFVNIWDIGEKQTYPYLRVYPAGDINKDGIVNFKDLGFLALHWLENYNTEKPPQVQITYPEDGARLMVGGVPPQTMISAEANDYDGIVVRVEFFANDLKLGEDSDGSDGWNYFWQGYSLGWHVLTATAWDHEGLSGTSSPVNVEVWMPDPPPP